MDIFKFNPTGEQTVLERGELINGLSSKLWVERYSDPGEFSLEAPISSGLRDDLPLGTIIGQINSDVVMVVENHKFKEDKDVTPTVVISGRTLDSYLDQRVVGTPLARSDTTIAPYILTADYTWNQIKKLINDHISDTIADDDLDGVEATTSLGVVGSPESIDRTINRGYLSQRVKELLAVDDLGIRVIRHSDGTPTELNVYRGINRRSSVIFSWVGGDLETAEYLFSQKNNKNAALVSGQYVFVVVDNTPDKYDRRFMLVDATDVDSYFTEVPTGLARIYVELALAARGKEALRKQNNTAITQADISVNTNYVYRKDFNVGDLVTIDGNFNQVAVMRITEYAEIEDANGESGHPTLAFPLD